MTPNHFQLQEGNNNNSNYAFGQPNGTILDQNDTSFLGNFFNNPDNTANSTSFNWHSMDQGGGEGADGGGGGNINTVRQMTDLAYDFEGQSGTVDDPSMSLAAHGNTGYATNMNGQRRNNVSQVPGTFHGGDGNGDGGRQHEESEEAKEAAVSLSSMAANGQRSDHRTFHANSGLVSAWGTFGLNNPLMTAHGSMPNPNAYDSAAAEPRTYFEGEQQLHTPFGYHVDHPSQQPDQKLPPQAMYPRSSYRASHASGHELHMGGAPSFHQTDPQGMFNSPALTGSAQPHSPQGISRPPRYGSDPGFDSYHYRPQSSYQEQDEKAANLNHVPLVAEARANSQPRRNPSVAPKLRTHPASFTQQAAAVHSPSPHHTPASPAFPFLGQQSFNNMNYFGGLPQTGMTFQSALNGSMHPAYGFGQGVHGHPARQGSQNSSRPQGMGEQLNHSQVNHRMSGLSQQQDDDNSETQETDESQIPLTKGARGKRRKSDYEDGGEDEYQPPGRIKRARGRNITADSSDDDDDNAQPSSSKRRVNKSFKSNTSVMASSSDAGTPGPASSPTTPATANRRRASRPSLSTGDASRPNLTEEQRRQNHIRSEKYRRAEIKTSYEELGSMVPSLKGGKSGHSKAEVLLEIAEFVEDLLEGNDWVLDKVDANAKGEYDSDDGDGMGGGAYGVNSLFS